jgi:hypothetical protein
MTGEEFTQTAPLWRWVTASGGHYIFLRFTDPVAAEVSALAAMRRLESGRKRGWGSLRVTARIGESEWPTSIFPGDGATWLLPVKAAVRKAEGVAEGDTVEATIWV